MNLCMLIGRKEELARLRKAILARHSLLVFGAPEAGKTALLNEALSALPAGIRKKCIICKTCETPRTIWQVLIRSLAEASDAEVISRVQRECGTLASVDDWLIRQTSLRLRGILRRAMRVGAYWVFLDGAAPLPDGVYRLLQEWVWSGRTPVIVLARGSTEHEAGRAARLFWHSGLRMELGPMQAEDFRNLLADAVERSGLAKVADPEFRDFVLEHSGGLPGKILRLCELAAQRAYQYEGHVKLRTLAIDFLLQESQPPRMIARMGHHG